jgi:predicted nuclease with TOPRIM domain
MTSTYEKVIEAQEKEITKLKEKNEELMEKHEKVLVHNRDLQDRIYALKAEYGADYGGDGMFKRINEALAFQTELNKELKAENKLLHERYDKAFGTVEWDEDARRKFAKNIISRLDAIHAAVEIMSKE